MMQVPTIRAKRPGVTIIEVVMAIVILSIALPPMVASFADASRQSIRPSNSTVASFLAIDRMEEVVARRYQGTDGYAALTVPSMSAFPAETVVSGFPLFARTTVIEYVTINFASGAIAASGSDKGYKRVRVTVTWHSGSEKMVVEHLFADFNL
jgi:prepilin-type N-terminal cleavage/methylation domain-containing protein